MLDLKSPRSRQITGRKRYPRSAAGIEPIVPSTPTGLGLFRSAHPVRSRRRSAERLRSGVALHTGWIIKVGRHWIVEEEAREKTIEAARSQARGAGTKADRLRTGGRQGDKKRSGQLRRPSIDQPGGFRILKALRHLLQTPIKNDRFFFKGPTRPPKGPRAKAAARCKAMRVFAAGLRKLTKERKILDGF